MWIVAGAAFDFLDGMSARLLGVSSPIGKELDSLADDVTFGVAPATVLFFQLSVCQYPEWMEPMRIWLPYAAYIMAAFSALRLAKFNLDTRQTLGFIGMPTPANALFWTALIDAYPRLLDSTPYSVLILLALMAFCSWLMVSDVPMFALKFKKWGVREGQNAVKYSFLAFSLAALIIAQVAAVPLIIVAYIAVSLAICKPKCS